MTRRELMLLLGVSAVPWSGHVRAQEVSRVYRIGFLGDVQRFANRIEAFREGLRDLGYVEGRNIVIEYRWPEGNPERLREVAEEFVRLKVDVIIVPNSTYTEAAKRASTAIPIVFIGHLDPVGTGHVASLSRPAGNITGLSVMMPQTSIRSLELFKQAVPGLTSVAVLFNPLTPSHTSTLKAIEAASSFLKLGVHPVPVGSATEYKSAFSAIVRERADGVLVLPTPLFYAGRQRLAELALAHKLPSVFGPKDYVNAGGLMSYFPPFAAMWRCGATYVDRILKGANPADLPVEQPTKFELVVNLKTAKALGITVPQSLLARADEVIE